MIQTIVRTCAGQKKPFFVHLRLLIHYREMLILWTAREIRSRYRQSLLGLGWAIVQPVMQMVVVSAIFGGLMHVPSEGFPYPIFAFTALLPWTLFANSLTSAIPSVSNNLSLVTKIYFPREILPLSAILARIIDFAVACLVFIAMMIWYHIPPHSTLVYVPLLLMIQTLLALGISLMGAAVTVFIRDVSFVLQLALQLWMYASPVIYPASVVPDRWRSLYALNPMAGIIESYRKVVLSGEPPDMHALGVATLVALALCVVSYGYFKRVDVSMSDVL